MNFKITHAITEFKFELNDSLIRLNNPDDPKKKEGVFGKRKVIAENNMYFNSKYKSVLHELYIPMNIYNTDEAGFAYHIDYGFLKLSSAKSGHSLSFAGMDLNNILNFIHTHPCGKENIGFGYSKRYKESVPMPSPKDVNVFKRLLIRAKVNNRKLENVFMTVVSCKGIFDLKYSGNGENLKN